MAQDLQAAVLGLSHRLGALEERVNALEHVKAEHRQDDLQRGEALNVMLELGLPRSSLQAPGQDAWASRVRLARELRRRRWTALEISRAMGCSERSVRRYLS